MRARRRTVSILAAVALAATVTVPAASGATPDPAYTVVGEVTLSEEEHPLQAVAYAAVDGSTLYLSRDRDVLVVDLATDERHVIDGEPLGGYVRDLAFHDGELFVLTDMFSGGPGELHVFDRDGGFLRTIETGPLSSPRIDIARDGTIFLLGGSAAGRVLRISPDGSQDSLVPGSCPHWEFVDGVLCENGHLDIAVTDEHLLVTNNRWQVVQVFDRDGAHLATVGTPVPPSVTLGSWEISTDAQGLVYLRQPSRRVEVLEIGSAPGQPVTLESRAQLPLDLGATELRGGHGAPVVTEDGTIVLTNASGSSNSRGNVLLLEPVREQWRAPDVVGTAQPGSVLTADLGLWPTGFREISVQWLRDSVEMPGATSTTFAPTAADVGSSVATRVTVDYGAAGTRVATSAPVTVAPMPIPEPEPEPGPSRAVVSVSPVKKSVRWAKKARLRVEVRSDDEAVPTGRVIVRAGKKQVASVALKAKHRGVRTVTLPRLAVGKHRLVASYSGSHAAAPSSATTLRVTKAKPKVTLKLKKRVRVGKRAKAVVRVKVTGFAKPKGKLVIRDGKKKLKVVKLKAKHRGRLTVTLPRLKPGKHKIKVTYRGTKQVKKKTSKAKVLRVVR